MITNYNKIIRCILYYCLIILSARRYVSSSHKYNGYFNSKRILSFKKTRQLTLNATYSNSFHKATDLLSNERINNSFDNISISKNKKADETVLIENNKNEKETVPLSIHTFWTGTHKLREVLLAAVDSFCHFMIRSPIYIHITVEEKITEDILKNRKSVHSKQIQIFLNAGCRVYLDYVQNITALTEGTVLSSIPIEQKHVGGIYGNPPCEYFGAHSADLLKALIIYREGGIALDDDILLFHDLSLLRALYGDAILTSDHAEFIIEKPDFRIQSGFFMLPKLHPYSLTLLIDIKKQIITYGLDTIFPYHGKPNSQLWITIGPGAAERANSVMIKEYPFPPIVINKIDPILEETVVKHAFNFTFDPQSLLKQINPRKFIDSNITYVLLSPKYLMPVFWNDLKFYENKDNIVKLVILASSFQIHIYNEPKRKFLNHVFDEQSFIFKYIHQRSCKLLCNKSDWVALQLYSTVNESI